LAFRQFGVQIVGDRDIVVTCPDSDFSITNRKDGWAQAWKSRSQKGTRRKMATLIPDRRRFLIVPFLLPSLSQA
jgi:hypothetical protein